MGAILFNIFILIGILFPAVAHSQIFLEEGKVVLSVVPGERINKSMTIQNTSNQEIHAKIYWEDFQYEAPYDGTKKFFPAGVAPVSASQWVNYLPHEITLAPFGKQKVDYSISVPNQFEKGCYGVLFFEQEGAKTAGSTGVDIVTRVGSLFFIEPKDAVRKASVENIVMKGDHLSGDFVNQSAVTLIPRSVYYLMEEGGMVKDRGELKNYYVPSGATASWELSLPKNLQTGRYSLVINFDLGHENVVTQEINLLIDGSGMITIEASKH